MPVVRYKLHLSPKSEVEQRERDGHRPLDVVEAIRQRQSIRFFDPIHDVPHDIVVKLIELATQAPSAGNIQPWRFYVVRDPRIKMQLAKAAYGQTFLSEAPVVIVVCTDTEASAKRYGRRGSHLYAIQDAAVATQTLMLAAEAEGLSTCWIGAFDEGAAAAVLNLERGERPTAIVPIGQARTRRAKPGRKPLGEVMTLVVPAPSAGPKQQE